VPSPPRPGWLTGRVLDSDGSPAAQRFVSAVGYPDPFVRTDREGRFWMAVPPRGRVRLIVRADGKFGEVEAAAGSDVTIRLRPLARVWGRVVGDAWPAWVLARSAEAPEPDGGATPDRDGRFLATLPPGKNLLTAFTWTHVVWPPVEVDLVPGETLRGVVLPLVPGARLSGVVRDATGDPVAGVRIGVESSAWRSRRAPHARTDESGRFAVEGLFPGSWRIRASRADWSQPVERTVDLALGENPPILLTAPAR
jgi:hypothetical protein